MSKSIRTSATVWVRIYSGQRQLAFSHY